jgi:hypothetical protein
LIINLHGWPPGSSHQGKKLVHTSKTKFFSFFIFEHPQQAKTIDALGSWRVDVIYPARPDVRVRSYKRLRLEKELSRCWVAAN